jgi:UDP-glucose 4-epimerase
MRILITGASGLLGGRLANYLHQQKKYTLTMLSRNAEEHDCLKNYGSVININWEDQNQLNNILKNIDIVVHAFGPSAQLCSSDPINQISLYKKYTQNLLKAINSNMITKVILLSSIHVYSENPEGDIDEKCATLNNHPYALSKIAVEDVINKSTILNTKFYTLRLSNCYGYPVTKSKDCWNLFVNDICRGSITNNSLKIKNNPYIKRDFLPVTYFCEVIEHFIDDNNIKEGLYNLTSGETRELIEFSKYIKNIIGKTLGISLQIEYKENYKKTNNFVLMNNKISSKMPEIFLNHEDEIQKLYMYCKDNFSQ